MSLNIAPALLSWYDRHARALPWRAPPGTPADPYRVWLSEIMLQQTTVAAAIPYFLDFTARWPDLPSLAAADPDLVMQRWAGLGYYARARNLLACARAVTDRHGGVLPADEDSLLALPGIGAYTAAAVAAIAFGIPATVVDGNVERVVARLFAVETPMPAAKPALRRLAATLTPRERPGDFAQAMMDLGATICIPAAPRCMLCPLADACEGRRRGIAAALPARAEKPAKPVRHGIAWWLTDSGGRLLLIRRPPRGLLGGLHALPSAGWDGTPEAPPAAADWQPVAGEIRHVFTHFEARLRVLTASLPAGEMPDGEWWPVERLGEAALPSLMVKVVRHVVSSVASGSAADRADRPRRGRGRPRAGAGG